MTGGIAFSRAPGGEVTGAVSTDVYVVDADGSERDVELLYEGGYPGRWSPDGTQLSIHCCDDGMAAHLMDLDTGEVRELEQPDSTLETFCGLWSPDAKRLACEGYGMDDPSRNGIYSILASGDGGLTRITSNPGGSDIPGDYSPDGTHLVFMRYENDVPTGLYVIEIAEDGTGQGEVRLTPPGMVLDDSGHAGRWSPDGEQILFVARDSEDDHKAIWVMPLGSDPRLARKLPIAPGCGGPLSDLEDSYGCYSPSWSPDGGRIVFTRSEPDGSNESIWVVKPDGSDLVQLTEGTDDNPTWRTAP